MNHQEAGGKQSVRSSRNVNAVAFVLCCCLLIFFPSLASANCLASFRRSLRFTLYPLPFTLYPFSLSPLDRCPLLFDCLSIFGVCQPHPAGCQRLASESIGCESGNQRIPWRTLYGWPRGIREARSADRGARAPAGGDVLAEVCASAQLARSGLRAERPDRRRRGGIPQGDCLEARFRRGLSEHGAGARGTQRLERRHQLLSRRAAAAA